MSEHTPTPWTFSPNSFGTQFIYGDLETPKQSPMGVTYFHLVCGGDHPGTLTEENAAFIVKACNAHDDLVKALSDILEANKDFRDGMPQSWDGDLLQDACDAAKTILEAIKVPV